MNRLDHLEADPAPFTVLTGGERVTLPGPRELPWQSVLAFLKFQAAPGTRVGATLRQEAALGHAWAEHHGLPSFSDAQRLCYLFDRYGDDLEYELTALGLDARAEWRARHWTRLLAIIDRLPRTSHYSAAVANDPEHAKMLADAIAASKDSGDDGGDQGPSIREWTPEAALLTTLIDSVNRLIYYTQMGAGAKNVPKPEPTPRPITALAREMRVSERRRRQSKHDSLVDRMLPHKRKRPE